LTDFGLVSRGRVFVANISEQLVPRIRVRLCFKMQTDQTNKSLNHRATFNSLTSDVDNSRSVFVNAGCCPVRVQKVLSLTYLNERCINEHTSIFYVVVAYVGVLVCNDLGVYHCQ